MLNIIEYNNSQNPRLGFILFVIPAYESFFKRTQVLIHLKKKYLTSVHYEDLKKT